MSLLYYLSRSNPPDNVEDPNKRPHLDPDLSPEPSIVEDLLVPTTMSDHSICIGCGIVGDPRCEKMDFRYLCFVMTFRYLCFVMNFRYLCFVMNYSPLDE